MIVELSLRRVMSRSLPSILTGTLTIRPIDAARVSSGSLVTAARAMTGAPSAKDTGALLAMAATLIASIATTPKPTRMGAMTAQGWPKPTSPSSSAPSAQASRIALHPDVRGRLPDDPALEIAERPGAQQRVVDDDAPERDPVDRPHAGPRADAPGGEGASGRRAPDGDGQDDRDDRTDDHRLPGGHPQHGQQDEQQGALAVRSFADINADGAWSIGRCLPLHHPAPIGCPIIS
jgi:hypothetical protein